MTLLQLIVTLCIISSIACRKKGAGSGDPAPAESSSPVRTSDDFPRGEWLRIDNGGLYRISDSEVISPDSKKLSFQRKEGAAYIYGQGPETQRISVNSDGKILRVEGASSTFHLIRSGIDDATITGSVDRVGFGLTSDNKVAEIEDISLRNLNDSSQRKSIKPGPDGTFSAADVQTGSYAVEIVEKGGKKVSVIDEMRVERRQQKAGTISVSGVAHNFKTSIDPGTEVIYQDKDYVGKISIKNIGSGIVPGANFSLSHQSEFLTIASDLRGILGTIQPNAVRDIPFRYKIGGFPEDQREIEVAVIIRDAGGRQWRDYVYLQAFRSPVKVSINANRKPVSGFVSYLDNKLAHFTAAPGSPASVSVPYVYGRPYYVVLSAPDLTTETEYSLGVGVEASREFESFTDTSRYEPNNELSSAHTLNAGDSAHAYLYAGDIDFYRFALSKPEFGVTEPSNLSVHMGNSVRVSGTCNSAGGTVEIVSTSGATASARCDGDRYEATLQMPPDGSIENQIYVSLRSVAGFLTTQATRKLTILDASFGDPSAATLKTHVVYRDTDGDGYGEGPRIRIGTVNDSIPGGYALKKGDCNDNNGEIWQILPYTHLDMDGDGYTVPTTPGVLCTGDALPAAYKNSANGLDCNDNHPSIWRELPYSYLDSDGDGYTVPVSPGHVCSGTVLPSPYANTESGFDCNDSDRLQTISCYVDTFIGEEHTCSRLSTGTIRCWGVNTYGQLGDGTYTTRTMATETFSFRSGINGISTGRSHTCAVNSAGVVMCWGDNRFGQLGDGTTTNRAIPTSVSGLSGSVIEISSGVYHTCALLSGGTVKCTGLNSSGQIGDGFLMERKIFTQVFGLSDVARISVGGYHSCALLNTGAVKCWGNNQYGQLGDGTVTNRATITDVAGLSSGVTAIEAGGYHTCVRLNTGVVKCWGSNSHGEIGSGTATDRSAPADVVGLSDVATISAGWGYTCATLSAGATRCWGYNGNGQLGDGTTINRYSPTAVVGLPTPVWSISAGFRHTCAVMSDFSAKCWGDNNVGQLGGGIVGGINTSPASVLGTGR